MLHCDVQADQKPGWVCGIITVSLYKDIEDSWAACPWASNQNHHAL